MSVVVPITIREQAGLARQGEPIRFGIPFPKSLIVEDSRFSLWHGDQKCSVQSASLARWQDGSVKWVLIDALVNIDPNETRRCEIRADDSLDPPLNSAIRVSESQGRTSIDADDHQCEIDLTEPGLVPRIASRGRELLGPSGMQFIVQDAHGHTHNGIVRKTYIASSEPFRAAVRLGGTFGRGTDLTFSGRLEAFSDAGLLRLETTITNPRRARHRDGYWDLGDPGSILMKEVSIVVDLKEEAAQIAWLEQSVDQLETCAAASLKIYQDSSGGEQWQSRNHVNRLGEIPLRFRGFRTNGPHGEATGHRASPVAAVGWQNCSLAVAMEEFWQKFPSSLNIASDEIRIGLLPGEFDDLHELQAGEHLTRVIWFRIGDMPEQTVRQLAWVHAPLSVVCDADWYAASGAIAYLPSTSSPPRKEFCELMDEALGGPRNFFWKREAIDEYGWRNYGDLWGDHEEAYYDGPRPIISHYNNQFDALHGFLIQYLLTGDSLWWDLADPLARHVLDIDIYHTDRDKPAYNGGLFWPTTHYYDAGTSTHRSRAREMSKTGTTGWGGGPGAQHNFAGGLLLYHYLTGNQAAAAAVAGLADWVIAMDDGQQHILGLLSARPTGIATHTTAPGYHGPGRAAANSINVLLDSWELTRSTKYLSKAEELIKRTIHPQDNIELRDLRWAEMRWSYPMHLQALGRYCSLCDQGEVPGELKHYARASLLHYARWMAEHEEFWLDRSEELEFPTETWAGQELRKGNVLLLAATMADQESDQRRFRQRGKELLDRAWESLLSFETRSYTRPLVLALQQGYVETYLKSAAEGLPTNSLREPRESDEKFAASETFIGQKAHIRSVLGNPSQWPGVARRFTRPTGWKNAIRQTWAWERCRRMLRIEPIEAANGQDPE